MADQIVQSAIEERYARGVLRTVDVCPCGCHPPTADYLRLVWALATRGALAAAAAATTAELSGECYPFEHDGSSAIAELRRTSCPST